MSQPSLLVLLRLSLQTRGAHAELKRILRLDSSSTLPLFTAAYQRSYVDVVQSDSDSDPDWKDNSNLSVSKQECSFTSPSVETRSSTPSCKSSLPTWTESILSSNTRPLGEDAAATSCSELIIKKKRYISAAKLEEKKKSKKDRRRYKRLQEKPYHPIRILPPKAILTARSVTTSHIATPLITEYSTSAQSTGFEGPNANTTGQQTISTIDTLLKVGFKLVEWNGRWDYLLSLHFVIIFNICL